MEEFVTAHENLNFEQMNLSDDPESSASGEPDLDHGKSKNTDISSSSFSSSSSVYYSARTESMIENKSNFSSELEMAIEYSKAHWSQLVESEVEEYSVEAILEHFERLKAHCGWGDFFGDFDSLEVGDKIAEGGQAEVYAATLSGVHDCAVKVFKEGYALRSLQRQWPEGMLKSHMETLISVTRLRLSDYFDYGRNPQSMKANTGPLQCILGGTLLKDERFKNRFAFVMKRQWGGDLRSLIDAEMVKNNNQGPPFSTKTAMKLMLDIAWDIRKLHQKYGIIHRDVKASNVLLPRSKLRYNYLNEISSIPIVLADYECSVGVVGTAFWRAPEILQQLKDNVPAFEMKVSFEADIYSYGMTCYEIATGCIPFEDRPVADYDFILNGARPELPHSLPRFIRKVITDCWHLDPLQRPPVNDIIDALQMLL